MFISLINVVLLLYNSRVFIGYKFCMGLLGCKVSGIKGSLFFR